MGTTNNKKPPVKKPNKKKRFSYKKLAIGTVITVILAVICAMGVYILIILNGAKILKDNINKLDDTPESTLIYDSANVEVAKLFRENRESVDAKDIPERVKQAFIATEDRRFESHAGVDFWAIGRALVKDITQGSMVEGGSTITQQLAKNVFLTSQKNALRKATEVSIAIALENNYTKDEILEKYLNRIFFGSRAYGIKAAAKVYFNQPDLSKLELWQVATLAALPKAPSYYSPLTSPDKSKERRAVVLKLMADQGYITEQERAAAAAVDYVPPANAGNKEFATFMDYVVQEAENVYNINEDELLTRGYRIYTTMDTKAQRTIEQTYANPKFFQQDAADGQKIQSAMVIINHKDGGLIGMIGGRDYQTKGLNRIYSLRQPGSSFKPIIVYGPALEDGRWNPYSKLDDTQKTFGSGSGSYTPRNYDNTYSGQIDMFESVRKSKNVPAVDLLDQMNLDKPMAFAKRLGIEFAPNNKDKNLAIALGGLTNGVSPIAMATAYGAFANQGVLNKTHAITKITDSDGKVINTFKPEKTKVMEPKTAYYMTLLMQGVVEPGGTGVRAKFDRPLAGKTGSTGLDIKGAEKYDRDIWFTGFTPEWTAAVWEGFDKTDTKHYVTVGSGNTAAIFKEIMSKSLAGKPMTAFTKPDGVPALNEPPKGISDVAATYVKETKSVKLNWTPLGNNVAYQVFRKGAKEADFKLLIQSPTAEVNDTTVNAGETYQYYVIPINTDTSIVGDKSNVVEMPVPQDGALIDPFGPSGSPTASPSPGNGKGSPSPSISPGTKPSPSPGTGGNGNIGGIVSPTPTPSFSPSPSPSPSANSASIIDGVVNPKNGAK
jgi:penicillin-binding protein 2A